MSLPREPGPDDAAEARDSFRAFKERLDAVGFRPSRRLGQNFLLDATLHRVIADAVAPTAADLVLEVGAGLGFLTRELAGRSRVLAVEIDPRLYAVLDAELRRLGPRGATVELLHSDVLQRSRIHPDVAARLTALQQVTQGRFLVAANLPYAISGPLLAELVLMHVPPTEMALLVQLEVAQRICAAPGTKAFGALSALLQLAHTPRLLRRVSAQVFRPRPQVESAIVHLGPPTGAFARRPAAARREVAVFLRQLFASRRKKLGNARVLAAMPRTEETRTLLDARAEELAPHVLLELFDRVAGATPDPGRDPRSS
ncbi:MAG: ribosomal RNA small subunit methyltransferase A [Planctomycetes bacterium]|nr:ribosomal RNA small subunit methyltransferase A [Planctomycetota bacterium]MCB9868476.1 ribosomal RNA small subunit methyltransferase A [Planctomycetota bacterium]